MFFFKSKVDLDNLVIIEFLALFFKIVKVSLNIRVTLIQVNYNALINLFFQQLPRILDFKINISIKMSQSFFSFRVRKLFLFKPV